MNKSLIAIGLAGFALTACDTGLQDGGSDTRVGMNGLVVDGRVAFGKVWVDMNNNNKIDDFEPYAFTDSQGYYSYNPNTPKDYCALDTTDSDYKHCLKYGSSVDSTVIRISGGTDLATGEKLKGVMAMATTIGASQTKASNPLILSPITTLLESADTEEKRDAIKTALGIGSEDDLKLDFSNATDAKTKKLYANAVALQTMVDLLVAGRDEDSSKTDAQLQQEVIDRIADTLASKTSGALTDFSAAELEDIASSVTSNPAKQNTFRDRVSSVKTVLAQIEDANSDVAAIVKTSEVMTQMIRKELEGDASAGTALDTVNFSALTTAMTGNVDIKTITSELVENPLENLVAVINEATLENDVEWGGKWFVLRAADDAISLTDTSYIAMKFSGDGTSSGGTVGVCANVSEEVEGGETLENEFISGTWSKLTDSQVVLIFNYEGLEFEGLMKARSATATSGNKLFRFTSELVDEQGDLENDTDDAELLANVSVPTNSDFCANNVDTLIPQLN